MATEIKELGFSDPPTMKTDVYTNYEVHECNGDFSPTTDAMRSNVR